eukprot:5587582-Ditylum_brightwellii.AAC.1
MKTNQCQCQEYDKNKKPTGSPLKRRESQENQHFHVHCTEYTIVLASQLEELEQKVDFDTDRSMIIVENSANAHIIKDHDLFEGTIKPMNPSTGITSIGGTDHKPAGYGNACLSWKDNE